MSIENLTTYLNDHLAGSIMALELIKHAAQPSAGTPLARSLEQLHGEIEEDQTVVRDLLRRLDASENPVKQAAAWLAEKAGRVKIDASDTSDPLGRLEALETLKLGILGKLALLVALEHVAGEVSALEGLDFPALRRRAQDQHDRVESWRLEAAREALRPTAAAALP
jgi:hypothetical protein